MKVKTIQQLIQEYGNKYPLEALKLLGGYYNCLKDGTSDPGGPLVGYAGKYDAGGKELAYVGHLYANFAKAEQWPVLMKQFGRDLGLMISGFLQAQDLLGALENGKIVIAGPEKGGFSIAEHIAAFLECRKVYIEKEITQQKSATAREQSILAFKRHDMYAGDSVIISEDVSNNFSTIKAAVKLIESYGATVVGISTIVNRSPDVEGFYKLEDGRELPIFAIQRFKAPEFRQDDALVAGHIASGNIIWKPKDQWDLLPEECKQ